VGGAKDLEQARLLFNQGCAMDHAKACLYLGEFWLDGYGGGKDQGRALELWEKACRLGDGLACANVGGFWSNGEAGSVDKEKAVAYFAKSCELGSAFGCVHLGTRLLFGEGCQADEAKARELFDKACEGGSHYGCSYLGSLFTTGTGGVRDWSRVVESYKKACALADDNNNCANHAWALAGKDDGLPEALEVMTTACKTSVVACHNLGILLWKLKKDQKAAFEAFSKSCAAQPSASCLLKQTLGEIEPASAAISEQIAQAASDTCNKDHDTQSCLAAGVWYSRVKQDEKSKPLIELGIKLLGQQCTNGDHTACKLKDNW